MKFTKQELTAASKVVKSWLRDKKADLNIIPWIAEKKKDCLKAPAKPKQAAAKPVKKPANKKAKPAK